MWGALPRAPRVPASVPPVPCPPAHVLRRPIAAFVLLSKLLWVSGDLPGDLPGDAQEPGGGSVGVVLWCRHSKPDAAPGSGQTAAWVAVVLEPSRDPVDIHLDLWLDIDEEAWEGQALSAGCTVTSRQRPKGAVGGAQKTLLRRLGPWVGSAGQHQPGRGHRVLPCRPRHVLPRWGGPGQLGLPRWHLQAGGRSISSSFSVRES